GQVEGALIAGTRADEPLLEALEQRSSPELHELISTLAAPEGLILALRLSLAGHRSIYQDAPVIDDHEVARGGGSLGRLQAGKALAHELDLGVDLLLAHRRIAARDLEALVLAQLGRRHDPDLDREMQRLPARRQLAEVDLGVADGDDAGPLHRVGVPAGQLIPHGLLERGLAAGAVNHGRRGP